jgi:hypothetical protein
VHLLAQHLRQGGQEAAAAGMVWRICMCAEQTAVLVVDCHRAGRQSAGYRCAVPDVRYSSSKRPGCSGGARLQGALNFQAAGLTLEAQPAALLHKPAARGSSSRISQGAARNGMHFI